MEVSGEKERGPDCQGPTYCSRGLGWLAQPARNGCMGRWERGKGLRPGGQQGGVSP